MNDKLIAALLAILLALGGWNLSQTFKLSNEMVLIKENVSQIEKKVSKRILPKKKPRKKNKNK